MVSSISVPEFLQIQDKVNIIDVRIVENYNRSHIPGAKNITANTLLANPSKYLNLYEKYYIYCQTGISSIRVCTYLKMRGYNVINLTGGYEEWILTK